MRRRLGRRRHGTVELDDAARSAGPGVRTQLRIDELPHEHEPSAPTGSQQRGVIVLRLKRGSRSHRIGVQPHDIILSLNGYDIRRVEDLERAIVRVTDQWRITLKRDGRW